MVSSRRDSLSWQEWMIYFHKAIFNHLHLTVVNKPHRPVIHLSCQSASSSSPSRIGWSSDHLSLTPQAATSIRLPPQRLVNNSRTHYKARVSCYLQSSTLSRNNKSTNSNHNCSKWASLLPKEKLLLILPWLRHQAQTSWARPISLAMIQPSKSNSLHRILPSCFPSGRHRPSPSVLFKWQRVLHLRRSRTEKLTWRQWSLLWKTRPTDSQILFPSLASMPWLQGAMTRIVSWSRASDYRTLW